MRKEFHISHCQWAKISNEPSCIRFNIAKYLPNSFNRSNIEPIYNQHKSLRWFFVYFTEFDKIDLQNDEIPFFINQLGNKNKWNRLFTRVCLGMAEGIPDDNHVLLVLWVVIGSDISSVYLKSLISYLRLQMATNKNAWFSLY